MRVHTRVAKKDYPEDGITRGDTYYKWTPYRQRARRSKTPPSRSQLTNDEGKQMVYDGFDHFQINPETIADDIRDLANTCGEAASHFSDKYEELNAGLQQAEVGQNMDSNRENCEQAQSDLDSLADEVEDKNNEDYWKPKDGKIELDTDAVMEEINGFEPELN